MCQLLERQRFSLGGATAAVTIREKVINKVSVLERWGSQWGVSFGSTHMMWLLGAQYNLHLHFNDVSSGNTHMM